MTAHLDDGALVRQLGGALEQDEATSVPLHLASCDACADRLELFGKRFERFRALLRATDVPVPVTPLRATRRATPARALAVAAVVLLLASAAVAASPARAWIVERSRELWTMVIGGGEDVIVENAPATPLDSAAAVSFAPAEARLFISVAQYQTQGTVIVETGDVTQVTAEVRGGSTLEDLVVLPEGLRIVNVAQSTADYRIVVPATLLEITVEVAGQIAVRFDPGGAVSSRTISLRQSGGG
jgi:hypothetical protein